MSSFNWPSQGYRAITVLDFGADPTGVTDSTTAINNALASLTGGGSLYFPTGTYKTTGQILCLNANVTVYGDGEASLINFANAKCFNTNANGVRFRNIWLQGPAHNSLTAVSAGIHASGSTALTLTGVTGTFKAGEILNFTGSNTYSSIAKTGGTTSISSSNPTGTYVAADVVTGATSAATGTISAVGIPTYITDLQISNCKITNFNEFGILGQFVSQALYADNIITDIAYAGILLASCSNSIAKGNIITNVNLTAGLTTGAYGIATTATSGSVTVYPMSSDILITGNSVENIPSWEAYDTHGGLRINIIGNIAKNVRCGASLGLVVTQAIAATNCSVIGNVFYCNVNAKQGITVSGDGAHGSVTCYATDNVIANNQLYNCGDGTTGNGGAGIMLQDTQNSTVSGNLIDQPSPFGIYLDHDNFGANITGNTVIDPYSASNPTSAIYLANTYNDCFISGNYLVRGTASATHIAEYFLITGSDVNSVCTVGANKSEATIAFNTGAYTALSGPPLSASLAVASDSNGNLTTGSTTSIELGYVHGVTSAIQTQLNSKSTNLTITTVTASGTTALPAAPGLVFCNTTLGVQTLTMPPPVAGLEVIVQDVGNGSNHNVTISPNGSEHFSGANNLTITTNYGSYTLFSDGTSWYVTSKV